MADNTPGQVFGPQNTSGEADVTRPEAQASPTVESTTPEPTPRPTSEYTPEPSTSTQQTELVPSEPATSADTPVSPDSSPSMYQEPIAEPNPYQATDDAASSSSSLDPITWTASEYIAHHKTPLWYAVLAVLGIVLTVGVYAMTGGDIFSTVAVVLVTTIFAMYAARKPQVQQYAVGPDGITIGQRTYSFHEIKSFALIDEGPFRSISFMPLKRFMPIISIYFDPADEAAIVDFLSNYLPVEHRDKDLIDRLMRKLKF